MTRLSSVPIFFVAICLSAQSDPALSIRLDDKISSALAASGAPSVSVAVVNNKQLVYAKAFGKANLAQDKTAGATTGTKARRVKSRI